MIDSRIITENEVAIEAELNMLLPALERIKCGQVVVLVQSHRLEFVEFLPFQLHARWPDALQWLPLTANMTVIPFKKVDLETSSFPFFRVGEVLEARRAVRWVRFNELRYCNDDLVHSDWEVGVERLRRQLSQSLLPPHAFVSVECVRPDGSKIHIPRRTLGRHAAKDAPRPRVLIPGTGEISPIAAETLASTDLVLVNLQGLRGRHSLRTIRAVLAARSPARPTLLVASSPSELFAIGLDGSPDPIQIVPIGLPSPLEAVDVITVARERLAADERFVTALQDLSGQGTSTDRIVALARNAWWAIRQSVHLEGGLREIQRFEYALEDFSKVDALTASLFTACRDLLLAAAADEEMRFERLRASSKAVLHTNTPGSVLVFARTWKDAATLRTAIAKELDILEENLEELGIWVDTVHAARRRSTPGTVVSVGYAGMATLDFVLASGARRARMVFDPVETRIAWHNAQSMAAYLDRAGASDAAGPLRRLANDLSQHVVGFASTRELFINQESGQLKSDHTLMATRPCPDEVLVYLTDGSCLEVPVGARFEVLGSKGVSSRVTPVTSLVSGNEIVLLDDEARTVFSEQRVAALDSGPLKGKYQARSQWLAIIQAVAKTKGLTPAEIAREMLMRGHRVTVATVRSWFTERSGEAHAPMKIERFLVLAEVLGLKLSEEMLRHYHQEIRLWRIGHRRAGREVAQAIRLACTGRLGPVTLARIERDWGVGVRALVAAARIGMVDEIILPKEA